MVELLPRLRRFAYALTGNLDQANDLVQETCVRALEHMKQWQPGTRLDSWMFRIAQNTWYDQMRAKKVRGSVIDIELAQNLVGSDGRDVTDARLTLERVQAGLKSLPADQQVLVALICIDGMSYKEAAGVLDLPIGTVMSRLSRARKALHEAATGETDTKAVARVAAGAGRG